MLPSNNSMTFKNKLMSSFSWSCCNTCHRCISAVMLGSTMAENPSRTFSGTHVTGASSNAFCRLTRLCIRGCWSAVPSPTNSDIVSRISWSRARIVVSTMLRSSSSQYWSASSHHKCGHIFALRDATSVVAQPSFPWIGGVRPKNAALFSAAPKRFALEIQCQSRNTRRSSSVSSLPGVRTVRLAKRRGIALERHSDLPRKLALDIRPALPPASVAQFVALPPMSAGSISEYRSKRAGSDVHWPSQSGCPAKYRKKSACKSPSERTNTLATESPALNQNIFSPLCFDISKAFGKLKTASLRPRSPSCTRKFSASWGRRFRWRNLPSVVVYGRLRFNFSRSRFSFSFGRSWRKTCSEYAGNFDTNWSYAAKNACATGTILGILK
mmetsp:Transcript_77161/g.236090  ORF Transcript_77161/g.236090 Transcript_77161/m.236090 type:complete len:383 (-) Transcript_77161:464-1612(-)